MTSDRPLLLALLALLALTLFAQGVLFAVVLRWMRKRDRALAENLRRTLEKDHELRSRLAPTGGQQSKHGGEPSPSGSKGLTL